MSCIYGAYDLGAAPARYLCSGKKEENYAASILKTTAAIALLVPGIILAVSSFVLNMLISPCCGSQFKGRVTNQSGEIKKIENKSGNPEVLRERATKEQQQKQGIDLLANLSRDDWKKWGTALLCLEEGMKNLRLIELCIVDFFQYTSKNGPGFNDRDLNRKWERSVIYHEPLPKPNVPVAIRNQYFAFPDCLKQQLSEVEKLGEDFEKDLQARNAIAASIYKDREICISLLDGSIDCCDSTLFDFLSFYDKAALERLMPLQKLYYEEVISVYNALHRLYSIEGNEHLRNTLATLRRRTKASADELNSKIEEHLRSRSHS